MRTAIDGVYPKFEDKQIDGEADPHGDAEELARGEMREAAGGEEDAHDRACGSDAEENGDGAKQPAAFEGGFANAAVRKGPDERVEEQRIEQVNGEALGPSADGVEGHGVRGEAHDGPERKQDALRPAKVSESREDRERRKEHEGHGGNDVREGERGMGGEDLIEPGHLGRSASGGGCNGEDAPENRGDADHHAQPEADAECRRPLALSRAGRRDGIERSIHGGTIDILTRIMVPDKWAGVNEIYLSLQGFTVLNRMAVAQGLRIAIMDGCWPIFMSFRAVRPRRD